MRRTVDLRQCCEGSLLSRKTGKLDSSPSSGAATSIVVRQLTIIWSSNFHCGKGRESTDRIRRHLGPFGEWKIEHVSIPEMQAADPMLDEALELGGKVVDYTEE
jgi:hypothetical protein